MPQLLAVDANSLLNRAYYGGQKLEAPDGRPTGAVHTFMNMLLRYRQQLGAEALVLAFDRREKTERHELFAGYKAGRRQMEEDLALQFELLRDLAQKLGLVCLDCPGFEADDILGSLAEASREADWELWLLSSDRDLLQLIHPNCRVLMPPSRSGDGEALRYDEASFQQKYGLRPDQFVDVKALMGDDSDRIPGVHGVGEKTAFPLIAEYGSLDGVYAHLEQIRPRIRKLLQEGRDQAYLSQVLARIRSDAPCVADLLAEPDFWKQLCWRPEELSAARREDARHFLQSLGLLRLQARLGLDQSDAIGPAAEASTAAAADKSPWTWAKFALGGGSEGPGPATLAKGGCWILAYAPSFWAVKAQKSAQPLRPRAAGLILAETQSRQAYLLQAEDLPAVWEQLQGQPLISYRSKEVWRSGLLSLQASEDLDDLETLAYVYGQQGEQKNFMDFLRALASLQSREPYGRLAELEPLEKDLDWGLEDLQRGPLSALLDGLIYAWEGIQELQDARGREASCPRPWDPQSGLATESEETAGADLFQLDFSDLTQEPVEGAQGQPQASRCLDRCLRPQDGAGRALPQGLEALYRELDSPLTALLGRMESRGIGLDRELLRNSHARLEADLARLETEIYALAGRHFNILSPQQLSQLLYEELQLPKGKKRKTGYSTDQEELERLRAYHPIVAPILEYRGLAKLDSTFVRGLEQFIQEDGRIHSSFQQNLTQTGRLSSRNPNVQNIPVRTEVGAQLRRAFVAAPGHLLFDADYSQIELRVLAALAGEEAMIRSFQEGADIHRRTAAGIFHKAESEVTPEERAAAKTINFSVVYGISAFSLAKDLDISLAAARDYIEAYHRRYPGIARFQEATVALAEQRCYVETLLGRRRLLPEIRAKNHQRRAFAERAALNSVVQGTAAEIIRLAMLRVDRRLRAEGLDAHLVLQVHDELLIEGRAEQKEEIGQLLQEEMEAAIDLGLPLQAEWQAAPSWGAAKA